MFFLALPIFLLMFFPCIIVKFLLRGGSVGMELQMRNGVGFRHLFFLTRWRTVVHVCLQLLVAIPGLHPRPPHQALAGIQQVHPRFKLITELQNSAGPKLRHWRWNSSKKEVGRQSSSIMAP